MKKTPYKNPRETKHPVVVEFEELVKISLPCDRWDKLFLEFYDRNIDFINNVENVSNNLIVASLIEIKFIYIRILDGKEEYNDGKEVASHIKMLLDKIDKNYYRRDFLYVNGCKWVAINLGRRKKYLESNKIFKEIIKIDDKKEFCINWIASNYEHLISNYLLFPICFIYMIIFLWNVIIEYRDSGFDMYISRPYSTISSIAFIVAVALYFSINKLIKYILRKKYSKL